MNAKCYGLLATMLLGYWASAVDAQERPQPGPELDVLKQLVGTWDASVEAAGNKSSGTMTFAIDVGGLWLTSHFQGTLAGLPYEGRGFDTYDAASKKYLGVWIDSMSTQPMQLEGSWDAEQKTMTYHGTGAGPEGMPMKFLSTLKVEDKDHLQWVINMVAPTGDKLQLASIRYVRKAAKPTAPATKP